MQNLRDAWQLARENIFKAQAHQKQYYDRNTYVIPYITGDRVHIYIPVTKRGRSPKLTPMWHGPYRVVDVKFPNVLVQPCDKPRKTPMWVHTNHLKPTCESHVPEPSKDDFPTLDENFMEENLSQNLEEPDLENEYNFDDFTNTLESEIHPSSEPKYVLRSRTVY